MRAPGFLLEDLAYGQNVVELTVSEVGTNPDCHEYVDVPITLTSDCEYAFGSNFRPYQYGTTLDTSEASEASSGLAIVHPTWNDDEGAFDSLPVGVTSDSTTFSVSWAGTLTLENDIEVSTASSTILQFVVLCALLALSALAYYIVRARRDKRALKKHHIREVELPTTTTNPMSPHATSPVRALAKVPQQDVVATAVV